MDPCFVREDSFTQAFKKSRCLILHVMMADFVSVCSVHCKEDDVNIKLDFLAPRYLSEFSVAVMKQLKEKCLTNDSKSRQEKLEEAGHVGCSHIN